MDRKTNRPAPSGGRAQSPHGLAFASAFEREATRRALRLRVCLDASDAEAVEREAAALYALVRSHLPAGVADRLTGRTPAAVARLDAEAAVLETRARLPWLPN